jgi:hypothetical protein
MHLALLEFQRWKWNKEGRTWFGESGSRERERTETRGFVVLTCKNENVGEIVFGLGI